VLGPERDGDRATTTRSTVQTSSNYSLEHCTFQVEILPRIEFCQSLATRTALNLDGIDPGVALCAISQSLTIAAGWAA
jgi:hypothetical protein